MGVSVHESKLGIRISALALEHGERKVDRNGVQGLTKSLRIYHPFYIEVEP